MNKHTPGPWGNSDNLVICRGLNFIAHAHYPTDEGDANTRLIAAAPDLLDALSDLFKAIEEDWNVTLYLAKAEKAIAKAIGE